MFSLLKLMFGDLQMSALEDMIQAALMLKYNKCRLVNPVYDYSSTALCPGSCIEFDVMSVTLCYRYLFSVCRVCTCA